MESKHVSVSAQQDIVIVGSGGLAREVMCLLEEQNRHSKRWNILGFISQEIPGTLIHGYPVLGDDLWLCHYQKDVSVAVAVGSPSVKRKIVASYEGMTHLHFPSIVSEHATVSPYVMLGAGCIICAGTIITADITVGNFAYVNLNCTIGHDAVIGNFANISPGCCISGNVTVGEGCDIGTHAVIIQGIQVGSDSVIGAGTVIIRNIPSSCTAVGNPARIIKK